VPNDAAVALGVLYVADSANNVLRAVATATGVVSTLAGGGATMGTTVGFADGAGSVATFSLPVGLGLSPSGATLYVTDYNSHLVRAVDVATRTVTTLAGAANSAGFVNAAGAGAKFANPSDAAAAADGLTVFVVDRSNVAIRAIVVATRAVTTLAGGGSGWGDAAGSLARFIGLESIAFCRVVRNSWPALALRSLSGSYNVAKAENTASSSALAFASTLAASRSGTPWAARI
jgi:hypothetical protein